MVIAEREPDVITDKAVAPPETLHEHGEIPNPSIYLFNTCVELSELSHIYNDGEPMHIIDVPDHVWRELASQYDAIWFLGAYKRSEKSREHALKYINQYPSGTTDNDVVGSAFAVTSYEPNPDIAASWEEWDAFVDKLHGFGIRVFLDYIPNHVAVDHPWLKQHPDWFVHVNKQEYDREPNRYIEIIADDGKTYYIAHGADPFCGDWADTAQINYANPEAVEAMKQILLMLVDHCDGVRCDMASLPIEGHFTWGRILPENFHWWHYQFWQDVIPAAKEKAQKSGKQFELIAEAYRCEGELWKWFDGVYAHDLYKNLVRLKTQDPPITVRDIINHLYSIMTFSKRQVVYIENHDEELFTKVFGEEMGRALFILLACLPNTYLLVNDSQVIGRPDRVPMQVRRVNPVPYDENRAAFYRRILHHRQSDLFRLGKASMVDVQSLDTPNFIALHRELQRDGIIQGATVIVNCGREYNAEGSIPMPAGATNIHVIDMVTGKEVPQIAQPFGDRFYIKLGGGQSQMVTYSYSVSS